MRSPTKEYIHITQPSSLSFVKFEKGRETLRREQSRVTTRRTTEWTIWIVFAFVPTRSWVRPINPVGGLSLTRMCLLHNITKRTRVFRLSSTSRQSKVIGAGRSSLQPRPGGLHPSGDRAAPFQSRAKTRCCAGTFGDQLLQANFAETGRVEPRRLLLPADIVIEGPGDRSESGRREQEQAAKCVPCNACGQQRRGRHEEMV